MYLRTRRGHAIGRVSGLQRSSVSRRGGESDAHSSRRRIVETVPADKRECAGRPGIALCEELRVALWACAPVLHPAPQQRRGAAEAAGLPRQRHRLCAVRDERAERLLDEAVLARGEDLPHHRVVRVVGRAHEHGVDIAQLQHLGVALQRDHLTHAGVLQLGKRCLPRRLVRVGDRDHADRRKKQRVANVLHPDAARPDDAQAELTLLVGHLSVPSLRTDHEQAKEEPG